jgi:hypothetical protein
VIGLRYSPENACCLCVSCHKYGSESFHQNPLAFYRWYSKIFGEEHISKLLEASKIEVIWTEKDVLELEEFLKILDES